MDFGTFDPAKFEGLFSNPTFQFGLNLLGNARQPNAMGQSFGVMQKMQQLKMEQQIAQHKQAQEEAVNAQNMQYQQAQMEDMQKRRYIENEQFGRQQALADQTILMERQKLKNQQDFMDQAKTFFGQGGTASPPQAAPAAGGAVGKYGTPISLLQGLKRTESGGNPNAIGPVIPGATDRALGAFQFRPSTIDMMRKLGHPFDPFNEGQSQDAADHYLQILLGQNGGDWSKTLAAYGGFKTKDPTKYVNGILGNGGAPVAQPTMQLPQQAGPNPLQMAQLGAMAGMAGIPGGQGLIDVGKMMQPQSVPAGGYLRGPDGSMTYLPDPSEAQRRAQQQQTVDYNTKPSAANGLPQKVTDELKSKQFEDASKTIDESRKLHAEIPNQIMAIRRARDDIEQMIAKPGPLGAQLFMGKGGDTKLAITKLFANTFGYPADPNVMRAEDFDSAMAQLWMKAVKQVDQNPTANQQKSIMQSFGTRTNDPSALPRILAETEKSLTKVANIHNQMVDQYSKSAGTPFPIDRTLQVVPAPPKRGTIKNGYMYNGSLTSDPRDQSNWVPVPGAGGK